MEQLLVDSWMEAGQQKNKAMIKLYLGSSEQVKVNELNPNDHDDFLGQ